MSRQTRKSLRALTLSGDCPHRFISDNRVQVNICALNSSASMDVEPVRGRSVLIRTNTQLATVLALLDLDGVAARVVLCPPDQAQHAAAIKDRASIDLEIASSVPVYQHLGHPVWEGDRNVETEWVLLTSGTTGLPKMTIHTLSSLVGPLNDGLNVAAGAIWSTFYDVRRYGGMQILLRALLGGGSMILSSSEESPTELLKRLGGKGVTHISGTPSHWRRALMGNAADAMSPSYVRLSGEIVDQAILDQLHRAYPDTDLGWAFASTEAGVAFDVRDGKAGFPASYIGDPNLKAEVSVKNGTLQIRSSRTARGYIDAPLNGHGGWIDTGDFVELRGDRYYFTGRREGVINVGGQKVYPEEVEAVARQHPAIQMARAKPRRSSLTGNLVTLDVVLHENHALSDIYDDLMAHCRRRLEKWKVPVAIDQVSSINITPAGKVTRA